MEQTGIQTDRSRVERILNEMVSLSHNGFAVAPEFRRAVFRTMKEFRRDLDDAIVISVVRAAGAISKEDIAEMILMIKAFDNKFRDDMR